MSLSAHQREELHKILNRTKQERDHAEAGKQQSVVPSRSNPYEEDESLGIYSTELY